MSTSLVERSTQPKLRSERHSDGDAKYVSPNNSKNTGFNTANRGHIIQANNRQVKQASRTGKLRENATSIPFDVTAKFVHFENACISSSTSMHPRLFPFQGRFNVYINGITANSKRAPLLVPFYVGATQPRNNFWIFEFINQSVPSDWKIRNEIIVLPTYWMDSKQVFIFWYHGLPQLYKQLRQLERVSISSSKEIPKLQKSLIVPRIREMPFGYRKTILGHGFTSIRNFSDLLKEDKPTCFRHVVAGEGNVRLQRRKIINALRKKAEITFNLSRVVCDT